MKTVYTLVLATLPLIACGGSASEEGQGDDDVTGGKATMTLLKEPFKKTVTGADGSKCEYDLTYARVLAPAGSPTSPTVALNAALNYGPQAPENVKCEENVKISGGFTQASVNEAYVLSVLYFFEADYQGMPGEFIKPINLNLSTGKAITLAQVLTTAGKEKLIATCKKKFIASLVEMQLPSTPQYEGICQAAVTVNDIQKVEDFTIEKAGLRIHLNRQLPHAEQALAGDGFLVKWSELGSGLKAGSPVKGLAGR